MFQDLEASLKTFLLSEMPAEYSTAVSILFGPPDSTEIARGGSLPAINLFLYDIKEDVSRRQVVPELERSANGTVARIWPPAVVDCYFLITAWVGAEGQNGVHDEHRLLGEITKALLRHRELPPSVLRGELAESGLEVTGWLRMSDDIFSVGTFWAALGGKPRATLSYRVSLQVPCRSAEAAGNTVKQVRL